MGTDEPKEFMDTAEMAGWLGVPEYTVTREAREGRLPGRKVGRGWRFSRTAVLEYFRGPVPSAAHLPSAGPSGDARDPTGSGAVGSTDDRHGCG